HFPAGKQGEKAFDFECVQSNMEHGLPLSREERDRAIFPIWERWGASRVEGETLDRLGKIFNPTKQRIHQIVRSGPHAERALAAARLAATSCDSGTGQSPK